MNSIPVPTQNQDELSAARALTDLQNNGSPASFASRFMPPMPPIEPMGLHVVPSSSSSSSGEKTKATFPMKLFEVLESGKYEGIVSWLPGGKAFIITDKKRFASDILPKYFKQSQFTSFTRKLSRWKFVRVPRGPYIGAYYHKLFRRDHKVLCKIMTCNDNECNLAMLAQAKQEIAQSKTSRSVTFGPSVAPPAPSLNQQQLHYIKKLEEMNRIASMKEQLLRIRLRRAQLYEQQKRMFFNASMNPKGMRPVEMNRTESENRILQAASRTLEQAYALEQKKQEIATLSTLRKTGMLPSGYPSIPSENQSWNGPHFLPRNAPNGFYSSKVDADWYKRNVFNANSA
jgi:hypothetical protein